MAMYMDNSQIVEKMRNAGIIEENGWLSRYVLVEKWPMPVQKEETISTKKEKKVNQSKAKMWIYRRARSQPQICRAAPWISIECSTNKSKKSSKQASPIHLPVNKI